jgi:hypothetical protein
MRLNMTGLNMVWIGALYTGRTAPMHTAGLQRPVPPMWRRRACPASRSQSPRRRHPRPLPDRRVGPSVVSCTRLASHSFTSCMNAVAVPASRGRPATRLAVSCQTPSPFHVQRSPAPSGAAFAVAVSVSTAPPPPSWRFLTSALVSASSPAPRHRACLAAALSWRPVAQSGDRHLHRRR